MKNFSNDRKPFPLALCFLIFELFLDTLGSDGKASAYNAGDLGSIPGSGRSPGEGNGNPLQYSCLENPMDGGAWWATVLGVAKIRTWLSNFTFTFSLSRYTNLREGSGTLLGSLAWKIPWTEEPGRLQSMGSLRIAHDWETLLWLLLSCVGEGNGNPLQCSCQENPRDGGAW